MKAHSHVHIVKKNMQSKIEFHVLLKINDQSDKFNTFK